MKKSRRKRIVGAENDELTMESGEVTTNDSTVGIGERICGIFSGGEGTSKITVGLKNVWELILRHKFFLVRTVLPAVYCLLFGGVGLDLGIYPFGISAVCAAADGKNAFIAAAAAAVSSLFVRGGFYICLICAAAAGAILLFGRIAGISGRDTSVLRAILSAVAGVMQTVLFVLPGGIGFYDLCMIVLSAAVCPIITVSLQGIFSAAKGAVPSVESGICTLFFSIMYFLRVLSPTGETVAAVISMLGVLLCTYSYGMKRGLMLGVAAGLAAVPEYSFIYAAAAIGSGVLMGLSPVLATFVGTMLALAFGIYSGGAYAFGDLFPELMFTVAVVIPIIRYKLIPSQILKDEGKTCGPDMSVITGDRANAQRKRLSSLSDGLLSVSVAMKKLSSVFMRPTAEEMRQMCDDAFDESCELCDNREICWGREYRTTAAAINAMASTARNGASVDESYLTEGMRQRCFNSDSIISRINMGARTVAAKASDKCGTADMAQDYENMSKLIRDTAKGTDEDYAPDPETARALSFRFDSMGLRATEVIVYGKRHRRILVHGLERGCTAGNEEIRSAAASVLGCKVTPPEYRIDGGRVSMSLHTAESFSVKLGRCSLAKRGETCGDCISSFKGDGGYFYTLISDGMGSGRDAALTSGVTAVFLERMLSAGATLHTALDMLNSFLSRRGTECFTTVDLLEADLITGELRFVKSGAAPSFVLRGNRLFKLSSKTVPVGIVSTFDAERLQFSAREGDLVIMLSDGAVPDGEDPTWLYELICGECGKGLLAPGGDLDRAAATIAKCAAEQYRGADDVTVGVLEICGCTDSSSV
ncbi:MAG: hypothetical protein E7578_05380 [Ruminococcaceae bacterium]|nr:hypothetical protein [Oscillospiraceae bacterium]